MRMTRETFDALPDEVRVKIMGQLRVFQECIVVFEYGRHIVGGGPCIKAEYGSDHKFIGIAYAEDFYSPEERICNYINAFHDYPREYKGSRNYMWLKWHQQMALEGHDLPVRLVNGNAMTPALGRTCRRCGSPVWISESADYSYQCFNCDEDLYTFEVIDKPDIEGTKIDTGFMGLEFGDGSCGHCLKVTHNIPSNRISLCAHCREEIRPCDMCDETCDWSQEELKCHRFDHTEEWKNKIRARRGS